MATQEQQQQLQELSDQYRDLEAGTSVRKSILEPYTNTLCRTPRDGSRSTEARITATRKQERAKGLQFPAILQCDISLTLNRNFLNSQMMQISINWSARSY